jgi:hypothetical protein
MPVDLPRKHGGWSPKQKGDRAERSVVAAMQASGFAAERTLRPGATPGRKSPTYDIAMPLLGVDRKIEVKARATGFAQAYRWLEGNYALVIRRDRSEPPVVLRLRDALGIARIAEKSKGAK